jgi:hypothetical protein
MDGTENDGVNIVLIAGVIVFAFAICILVGLVVWLYGRQSARRVKERQGKEQ